MDTGTTQNKLREIVNAIGAQDEVPDAINLMAGLTQATHLQTYEALQAIKTRTDIPLKVLRAMLHEATQGQPVHKLRWPNIMKNRYGQRRPRPNMMNFRYLCQQHDITFLYNDMRDALEIYLGDTPLSEPALLDIAAEVGLAGIRKKLPAFTRTLQDEITHYHPVQHWLSTGKWDGTDRISDLMAALDSPRCPDETLRIYLVRWLLGGLQAVYGEHGAPRQSMLVLHGPPGCGKTTFFERLMPSEQVYDWFSPGVRALWDRIEAKRCVTSWLVEVHRLDELLVFGSIIVGRQRTLHDVDAFLDDPQGRRNFYGGHITSYDARLAYAADRRYFVVPVTDIHDLDIDVHQLWLQIKRYRDDGQTHALLKAEQQRHIKYAGIVSTRPRWRQEKRRRKVDED